MNPRNWVGLGLLLLSACDDAGSTPDAGGELDAFVMREDCEGDVNGTSCGTAGEICLEEACVASLCGDGFIDVARGEDCEDGNDAAFDGCQPGTCEFTCQGDECDDGIVCNGMETCPLSTHVCEPALALMDGSSCTVAGGASGVCRSGECVATGCGNRVVEAAESCDDGNIADGDGCENDCRFTCEVDGATNSWFPDCDGDGYALVGSSATTVCLEPAPTCGRWTRIAPLGAMADCDDGQSDIFPGAVEVCDCLDNNCAGGIDEGVRTDFYPDTDRDTYGDGAAESSLYCPTETAATCGPPPGWVTNNSDCLDTNAEVNPGGGFHERDRGDGSFDYNCDGNEEPDRGLLIGCCCCESDSWGWCTTIPQCGEIGNFCTCIFDGVQCTGAGTSRVGTCR